MKCFQAEVFREFSIEENEYLKGNSYNSAWMEFGIWCKENNVQKCMKD